MCALCQGLGLLPQLEGQWKADGKRMIHDYTMTAREARAGAEANERSSAFRLAQLLGLGLGCPQDYEQAVRWYRVAAELGHPQAQSNLGFMYGTGRGVPQDYVRAYAWYNLAAASGEDTARRNRDAVVQRMSPRQLERAQDLSSELFEAVESAAVAPRRA
jgi:TPR repeat protein